MTTDTQDSLKRRARAIPLLFVVAVGIAALLPVREREMWPLDRLQTVGLIARETATVDNTLNVPGRTVDLAYEYNPFDQAARMIDGMSGRRFAGGRRGPGGIGGGDEDGLRPISRIRDLVGGGPRSRFAGTGVPRGRGIAGTRSSQTAALAQPQPGAIGGQTGGTPGTELPAASTDATNPTGVAPTDSGLTPGVTTNPAAPVGLPIGNPFGGFPIGPITGFPGDVTPIEPETPVVTPPPGAVPEPATWGMMLLGLMAVGASLRTRRVRNGGVFAR